MAGIPVTDETLAVEDIAKVGPFGDFLSLDSTLKHMRELSQPEVLDRRVREDWEARGSQELYTTCLEKARDVLREYHPEPCPGRRRGARARDRRRDRPRRRRRLKEAVTVKDQLKQAVIDGNADTALALTQALLASGAAPREILDEALLPGMEVVGERMREAEIFIPEVLLSARVMQACLDLLRPHMAAGEDAGLGTVVIGTVEGDLHDIGKNLVGMMLQGAGFSVVNLGTGVTSAQPSSPPSRSTSPRSSA